MDAISLFRGMHVVPVVVIEDVDRAVPLAKTLLEAGVGAMEITLRTDRALAAIERVARAVPELSIGAGSIRQAEQFRQVLDAGARFAVSPGSSERLLEAAAEQRVPFVPGAVTASEIIRLLERGYVLQKFFPAELSGGLAQMRALAAPLPEARFFPTGGISARLAPDYLGFDKVVCVGGSWFVPEEALAAGDFDRIRQAAAEAVAMARTVREGSRRAD